MASKETVTLDNIQQDLTRMATLHFQDVAAWRFAYILPITLIAVLLGCVFYYCYQNIWIGISIFLIGGYHIIRYLIALKKYVDQKKTINEISRRQDICISVERFSHISRETIYEPHKGISGRGYATKEIVILNFHSNKRWRPLNGGMLYEWSKEYYMSVGGLENISVLDDEFIYISLQSYQDIACVYPCKFFELDKNFLTVEK